MKTVRWTLLLLLINFNLYAIDLVNTSFIDFIRFVSNSTNKNFIIDEDIDKSVSIIIPHNFNNRDSFKVLKSILAKHDLYVMKIGTTYYIKKSDIESFHSYKLNYLLPDKVIPILEKYYPKIHISKSKKTIIYRSLYKEHLNIKKLISLLDQPTKSKKIKITLISYKESDLIEYGMSLDLKYKADTSSIQYSTFLSNLISSSSLIVTSNKFDISAFITDLQSKELIDSKFSPTLSLFDNEPTTFEITQKIPYLNGQTSINGSNDINNDTYSYNDVGSTIEIDKVSITDDEVYFHIKMKYEIILEKSLTPTTAKRNIDNYIKLKNKETLIIAGIKSEEVTKLHREIPLLSSIPWIGRAFQWDSNSKKNETFAIIITNVDTANKFAKKEGTRSSGEKKRQTK